MSRPPLLVGFRYLFALPVCLLTAAPAPAQDPLLRVDSRRLIERLEHLAQYGKNPQGGVSRVAFGSADLEARAWVMESMRSAGLTVQVDAAGNIVAARPGTEDLPPLMIGSHIDSVPMGGNYDGQVGSMAAIEVAEVLAERNVRLRHPLQVVIFSNEENGKTGSRAMAGEVEDKDLRLLSYIGISIRRGLAKIGGDPKRLASVRRKPGDVAAFLELHVEQGSVLDAAGIPIGVVEGIVGIRRWNVVFDGVPNHAGTTPMDKRRDALLAAARFVDAVNRIARETPGRQVATVGRIRALPGAPNVIPGRAELSLEIRDLTMEKIDAVYDAVGSAAEKIANDTGTSFAAERIYLSRAAPTDERVRRMIERAAAGLKVSTRRMPSGAGHDAQSIARFAPVGMIFIPSVSGISHSPAEFSRPEDIARGANLLLQTLLLMDGADW